MARNINPEIEFQLQVINQFAFLSSPAGVEPLEKIKNQVDSRLDNLLSDSGFGILDESFDFEEPGYNDILSAAQWGQVSSEANKVAEAVLQREQPQKPGRRSGSFAIPKAKVLDSVVSVESSVPSRIVHPDADSTSREASVLNQETALALEGLQLRRSQTPSKLPTSKVPISRPIVKDSRGFQHPDADITLRTTPSRSSSIAKESPFKSPLPPTKVGNPEDLITRAIPSPQKMAKTGATVKVMRRPSSAARQPDAVGAGEGVNKADYVVENALPATQATPHRGGRSLSKDCSPRFRSPFSSPLLKMKKGKSPSPVAPRLNLRRPIIGELASKAASLKAAVESGLGAKFAGGKGKDQNPRSNQSVDEKTKYGSLEVLPAKNASKMPKLRRERTFTPEMPKENPIPPAPGAKPKLTKPRQRRRTLNSGNKTIE